MKLQIALLRMLATPCSGPDHPLTFFATLHSSLVSFGPKQRSIGELAKTQEVSNFKNTIGSLKRLIGRTLTDPDVSEVESKFITAKLVDVNGTVGVQVRFLPTDPFSIRPSHLITGQLCWRAPSIFCYPAHRHVLGKTP